MPPSTVQAAAAIANESDSRIATLVADLASLNPTVRTKAREELVAIGRARKALVASRKLTVPSLIRLLSHSKKHVRWEAAKALGEIADPIAASALVNALDDRDGDVRWLAAEGLAALGRESLQPLLAALIERAQSCSFCEGAHHVCHTLVNKRRLGPILRPLLLALKQPEPEVAAPPAAYTALSKLRKLS